MKRLDISGAVAFALLNVAAVYAPLAVAADDGVQPLQIDVNVIAGTCIAEASSLTVELRDVSVGELNSANSASKTLQVGGGGHKIEFTCPTGKEAALKITPLNTEICETSVGTNMVCSTGENKSVALRFAYDAPLNSSAFNHVVDNSAASNVFKTVSLDASKKVAVTIGKTTKDIEMAIVKDVDLEPGLASFAYNVEIQSM